MREDVPPEGEILFSVPTGDATGKGIFVVDRERMSLIYKPVLGNQGSIRWLRTEDITGAGYDIRARALRIEASAGRGFFLQPMGPEDGQNLQRLLGRLSSGQSLYADDPDKESSPTVVEAADDESKEPASAGAVVPHRNWWALKTAKERRNIVLASVVALAILWGVVWLIDLSDDLVLVNDSNTTVEFRVAWRNDPYVTTWRSSCEGTLDAGETLRCERIESGRAAHVPVDVRATGITVTWQANDTWDSVDCAVDAREVRFQSGVFRCA